MAKKIKSIKCDISAHINTHFREYAIYTLESRGIPSFYDALTNVQRIILKNAKLTSEKTLSLLGDSIKAGYRHGDASLNNAISRITREFNCSENLLEGKGFWGTPVVPTPAAPRYTSVKLKTSVKNNHFTFSHLDEMGNEDWLPLHFKIPIGLTSMTTGIAVGYSTLILPRKIEDMQEFFDGKRKSVKPWFQNFNGTISKYKDAWLIKGRYKVDTKTKQIHIYDVPHMQKYETFMHKLHSFAEDEQLKSKIENNSAKKIDVTIIYKPDELKKITDYLDKITKILVKENIVFIKDNSVLKYNCIEDYLTDYKIRITEINYKEGVYLYDVTTFNLEYEEAKLKFLKYMLVKKRTRKEVITFINKFDQKISSKLDAIRLSVLTNESISECEQKIEELKNTKKKYNIAKIKLKKIFDTANKKFKITGKINTTNNALFESDAPEEIDGIEVFAMEVDDSDSDDYNN